MTIFACNISKKHTGVRNTGINCGRLIVIAMLCLLPILSSCEKSKNRTVLAGRLAAEEGRSNDDLRITELKADIRGVEKEVEKTIEAVRDKGSYWRLLGMKYMDYRMWGEAVDAFNEAIEIYPEYPALLYNRALSTGQLALSANSPESRKAYIEKAENGYRRTLTVDPGYTPAMYALAALLVFELDRPREAGPLLEDYLEIERSDVNGRFLLARVYLEAGRAGDALNLYDEITEIAVDQADVIKAEDLYSQVAGGGNGS